MHIKIDVGKMNTKRMPKGSIPYSDLDTFLMQFPLKMHPQIDTKIDVEKVCEIMRKCFQNDAKTMSKIDDKSMKFRKLRFLVFCEEYNVKIVFSHGREHPDSSRDQFWEQFSINNAFQNLCKIPCRKSMDNYLEMFQNLCQNEVQNQ